MDANIPLVAANMPSVVVTRSFVDVCKPSAEVCIPRIEQANAGPLGGCTVMGKVNRAKGERVIEKSATESAKSGTRGRPVARGAVAAARGTTVVAVVVPAAAPINAIRASLVVTP